MYEDKKGTIISVEGQVAEVEFLGHSPAPHDILVVEEDPSVKMEVYASSRPKTYFCIIVSPRHSLSRGARVINTGKSISIPAGQDKNHLPLGFQLTAGLGQENTVLALAKDYDYGISFS